MSEVPNQQGLRRSDLTEAVKRQVRQECYFGCVICGGWPYTYEHFDPPFVDAATHDPAGMALLCSNHQTDTTGRRLSKARIGAAREAPFNRGRDVIWTSHLGPGELTLVVGGNQAVGERAGFQINNTPVLIAERDHDSNEWWLTGSLVGPDRREVLRFVRNEIQVVSGSWDVKFEGTTLTVNRGSYDVVAKVSFDAEAMTVRLSRLKMPLSGDYSLDLNDTRLTIDGPDGQVLEMGGNTSSVPGVTAVKVNIGSGSAAEDRTTYTLCDDRLGDLADWTYVSGSQDA